MSGPDNQFQDLALKAAQSVQAARDAGEQLTFLPDEPGAPQERATRGSGKAKSMLREWLAARGYQAPEERLAEMAGLAGAAGDDAFVVALRRAEQVLLWAQTGAKAQKDAPAEPSLGQRLATFQFVFTAQLRALDALMPYMAPKATPDAAPVQVTQIVVPAAPPVADQAPAARPGMRDVTPADRAPMGAGARRIGPPPMPHEIQQNQRVDRPASDASDSEGRTE